MAMYSFMDGFLSYNQILMDFINKVKIAFITKWGMYCYKVMPFGLINASVTYQRMAAMLFHNMMYKEFKVYVEDMVVKSSTKEGHFEALEKFFQRIINYKLRLNPSNCVFEVTSEKLLGHVISKRGIEIDLDKVKVFQEMLASKKKKS